MILQRNQNLEFPFLLPSLAATTDNADKQRAILRNTIHPLSC